jgi:hypothetical protein
MFRKGVAFIVLLCHMNSSMFLPQGAEQDIFNSSGQQQDDINTVIEYIGKIVFGNHVNVPLDEDDDSGQNFHMVKEVNYLFEPFFTDLEQDITESKTPVFFDAFKEQKIAVVSFDIISPPPDVC